MNYQVHLGELGYLRVGAAVSEVRIGDIDFNVSKIIECMREAHKSGVKLLVFPEMSVTGYTVGDLLSQEILLTQARDGLRKIVDETLQSQLLVIVGVPLEFNDKLYNCAVAIHFGKILGIVPKSYLPSYREFYERRWFSSGLDVKPGALVEIFGEKTAFGTDVLFRLENYANAVIGIEVCEDLWVPNAPHEWQVLNGATILCNLSASNEVIGKAEWRRKMIESESGRCIAAYLYASCGMGESTQDVVFGGHAIVAENGTILRESQRFSKESQIIIQDIDLEILAHDRRENKSFADASLNFAKEFRTQSCRLAGSINEKGRLCHAIASQPFVPQNQVLRDSRCREVFDDQVMGLATKMKEAKAEKVVLGVSGGLDSALALLVAAKTMDFLGVLRTNVYAFSLPGFGTTKRTKTNAEKLCGALSASFATVDIKRSARSHLKDLGHDEVSEDVVFENVQARYRTEFLLNQANQIGALLLGTGDLTEIALGWCTFGGDHLSHYDVNCSVPKTLVRYIVRWVADIEPKDSPSQKILHDILDTPISPELRRHKNNTIVQKSEDVIGPIELQDFYLYPFVRFGLRPGKILFLAHEASQRGLFEKHYTLEELHQWLKVFVERFFKNQFKRTCMPEGPKVGSVSLSPRGDWRMPSGASPKIWLEDLEKMYDTLKINELKN